MHPYILTHPSLPSPQRRPRHRIARNLRVRINQDPLLIRLVQRRPRRPLGQRLRPAPRDHDIEALRIILRAVCRSCTMEPAPHQSGLPNSLRRTLQEII